MDFSRYSRIEFERAGRVLIARLNNPDRMNAVDGPMHDELAEVFYDLNKDEESDVIVLTGAGNAFSAGGDLNWMKESFDAGGRGPDAMDGKKVVYGLLDLEKPIVAAVKGPAIGLGATIALLCDVIYAGESARFADPHVRAGIVAGDGGAVIWPQLIGFARAKEYLMTGDAVDAKTAERIGLVNHVVPDDELDDAALAFAQRLAGGAIQAIKYTKVSVNIALKQLAHMIMDTSIAYEMLTFHTEDHQEAVRSFLEKRKPSFTGR